MMKLNWLEKTASIAGIGLALFATSCAKKTTFEKQDFQSVSVAAQYTQPKIDIVVFQDNSMSMTVPMQTLKAELDAFLTSVDAKWDIHFTVLPLQSRMSVYSKYIVASDCSTISGGSCLTPSQSSYFNNTPAGVDWGWIRTIDQSTANTDLGFQNILANLQDSGMTTSGFLRPDAPLAMIVLSNGEDVSGVSYVDRGDGVMVIDYNSSTTMNSFNSYKNSFQAIKNNYSANGSYLNFYSVVSLQQNTSCYNNPSFFGKRYKDMSSALGSNYYSLCDGNGLQYVMSNIASQINAAITAIKFNYAVIAENPIVSSIVVTKNGSTIPNDPVNGWSYIGYQTNAYTSYFPQLGNKQTGYFIKLNGTAVYSGSDVINVSYQKQ